MPSSREVDNIAKMCLSAVPVNSLEMYGDTRVPEVAFVILQQLPLCMSKPSITASKYLYHPDNAI